MTNNRMEKTVKQDQEVLEAFFIAGDGHRVCGGSEHDTSKSRYHGCCVRCLEDWPCAAEQQWQRIRESIQQYWKERGEA